MQDEALYYNAIAIALRGNQRALQRIRHGHARWEDAYHAFRERLLFSETMPRLSLPDPETEGLALQRHGVSILFTEDPLFPLRLREIPHPPLALYSKGDPAAVAGAGAGNAIAIVGTRKATPEGKTIARRFAIELHRAGCPIVSGLAFGIDAAAHDGCLLPGTPRADPPVAILAGGLHRIHPQSHTSLAARILAAGGALVTEYPLGEPPLPPRFIERNRIISGLVRGTLIVEAPEGSGALATARFAFEQNRDLFVVPGGIDEEHYRGSNRLIKEGATLVTSPRDIWESYGMVKERIPLIEGDAAVLSGLAGEGPLSQEESLIVTAIAEAHARSGKAPDVDKISAVAKLEPRIVNRTLTFLIMKGVVEERPGGYALRAERSGPSL
jgi:DNA processing protein